MPAAHIRPARRPVVAIITDRVELYHHVAYSAFEGYVRAVASAAGALPLLLPACPEAVDSAALMDAVDGILLTGSPSNVAAERYGAAPLPASTVQDPARDASVLPLLPGLVAAGMPILGICRGLQELNVAYGGTLDRAVHAQPGRLDHREGDHERPIPQWYEDRHAIHVVPGGRLAGITPDGSCLVNSLHHQGIERLGDGLRVEATAPDGLVEALSVEAAPQFTLAVQWHPEMRVGDCALSRRIFATFGEACAQRGRVRAGIAPAMTGK
ncbi:Gamma-glutamyl-gamma-aminobutyrate hydrolase PuuD [Cupriavidus laharis]|uniref:Gamma-glutamyl-gamma-aminobutyrate hydrolase PuuD n=1 Tax=Cupriavidus laharis TaxID=151654 RepID=A0ABM8XS33_9BURK|nr:gamma-glutamyl-gamma-aminobutyrate hydrolase family protein [Cupriavidus laharis]CAG9183101.1 Gamma-glutamyl-gamma-aminobutyrate hydrolase PuuD [Cupriavidus laharis]